MASHILRTTAANNGCALRVRETSLLYQHKILSTPFRKCKTPHFRFEINLKLGFPVKVSLYWFRREAFSSILCNFAKFMTF